MGHEVVRDGSAARDVVARDLIAIQVGNDAVDEHDRAARLQGCVQGGGILGGGREDDPVDGSLPDGFERVMVAAAPGVPDHHPVAGGIEFLCQFVQYLGVEGVGQLGNDDPDHFGVPGLHRLRAGVGNVVE